MKKKVMLFLMTVLMSFSAMCYASYGSDLDAETKVVDQFFASRDYKKIVGLMDPELAKELPADRYKTQFGEIDKELGKMTQKDLLGYRLLKDMHVLIYAAKFEKGAVLELDVFFKTVNGKPLMANFSLYDPNAQAQAQAPAGAEKK
jgi:hypothetical protein